MKNAKLFHQKYMTSDFERDGTILKNQYIREFQFYEKKLKLLKQTYQNMPINNYSFLLMIGMFYRNKNGVKMTLLEVGKMKDFMEKAECFSFETECSIDE